MFLTSKGITTANKTTFATHPVLDMARLFAAVKAAMKNDLGSFFTSVQHDHHAHIYSDWAQLQHVSVFYLIADMDIDCDGVFVRQLADNGGQQETAFGTLDAHQVPWFVLPQKFNNEQKDTLKPNALEAVICNGKIFYAIFGDTKSF
ncbi:fungal chitosanase of glycosyl hydrolase group 75-domain-containing protein [Mycena sp. CBHHK59/15]|nr:fungal chitosanase of glycosyl hydrolase group 75-domain-containing protein [Mycena sp. CBHHK59/15]